MPDVPEIVIDEVSGPHLYLRKADGSLIKIDLDPDTADIRVGGNTVESVPTAIEAHSVAESKTTRDSYDDLPEASITCTKDGKYTVYFDGVARNSSNSGYAYAVLNFKGTDLPDTERWTAGKYGSCLSLRATVQAVVGDVIKVRYRRGTKGSATISNKTIIATRAGD